MISITYHATPPGAPQRSWDELPHEERTKFLKDRFKKYTQKVRQARQSYKTTSILLCMLSSLPVRWLACWAGPGLGALLINGGSE